MTKTVLILGGNATQAYTVRRAGAIGLRTAVADRNPEAAAKGVAGSFHAVDISDQEGVLALARSLKVDGVLALNDFGVPSAAHAASVLGLPGISEETARNATSKLAMRRIWEAAGVPSARYRLVSTRHEAEEAAQEFGYPVIMKPVNSIGGGSRGVSLVRGPEELDHGMLFAKTVYEESELLVEEFLDGPEFSVETLSWKGVTHIVNIGKNIKTSPPYRVNTRIEYPVRFHGEEERGVFDVIRRGVKTMDIESGAAHVEFCLTRQGPKLIELGARTGGGAIPGQITERATGIRFLDQVLRLAVGEEPGNLSPTLDRACVYHFLLPEPGTIRSIEGVQEAANMPGVVDVILSRGPGDRILPVRTGLDRAGAIVVEGADVEEAVERGKQAEKLISYRYEQ